MIVYDRLLDAFCGKLVRGTDGAVTGHRDFATSDVAQFAELFIPDGWRDQVFGFVRGNVCDKSNIGLKATGNGMIAIANWHLLAEVDAALDEEEFAAPGATLAPELVVSSVLPLTPGRATGNSLDVLDRRYARGNVLEFLAGLPELMVFNDEAHHIHEFKREGEVTEVKFTGATEAVTIRLLNAQIRPSRPQLVTSISEAKGKEFFVKALRTKWDARRIRLSPGDRVSISLKSHKLLRGEE